MNPTDPNAAPDDTQSKPWNKPQDDHEKQNVDILGDGGLVDSAGADIISAASNAGGSVVEGAGAALDVAGGCADGCAGCSLAILVTLFAAAGTAMALFR
jgi:hypothetical protein